MQNLHFGHFFEEGSDLNAKIGQVAGIETNSFGLIAQLVES